MCLTAGHDERADLSVPESVLLWSMRAWTIGLRRGVPVEERIEEILAKIGAPSAAGQLYGFIWIIGHCAPRVIEVDCVCNPRISADEHRLLDILALTQHGRSADALALLRSLVPAEAAAVAAAASAQRIMAALTASGCFLSLRRRDSGRSPAMAVPDHRPITVH
jgi:hypothetical protein